ncbi:MAG: hypothetical protein ACREQN_18105 [Candidatus Binataceae bacterium]
MVMDYVMMMMPYVAPTTMMAHLGLGGDRLGAVGGRLGVRCCLLNLGGGGLCGLRRLLRLRAGSLGA